MSAMTSFYQNCPVCGRSLRIAVKYFGRPMSCAHCRGEFLAGREEMAARSLLPIETRLPMAADLVSAAGNCGAVQPGEI